MAAGIPLLEDEVLTGLVQQFPIDSAELPLLRPDLVHREIPYSGDKITWDLVVGDRGLASIVTMDGDSKPVAREAVRQGTAEPFFIQEHHPLRERELSLLRAPGADGKPGTPGNPESEQAVTRVMAQMVGRMRKRQHWAWAKVLSTGALSYSKDGVTFSLSYGLTGSLTAVGTAWTDAAAKTVKDIKTWLTEFAENAGYPATHIFFNPKIEHDYLLGNTQWLDLVKSSPAFASGVLLGQTEPFRISGINVTWVPVVGQYVDDSGSLVDWWDKTKLAFAAPTRRDVFEWACAKTSRNGYTGRPVGWSAMAEGDHKGNVTCYHAHNGLPVIRDPNAVQIVSLT